MKIGLGRVVLPIVKAKYMTDQVGFTIPTTTTNNDNSIFLYLSFGLVISAYKCLILSLVFSSVIQQGCLDGLNYVIQIRQYVGGSCIITGKSPIPTNIVSSVCVLWQNFQVSC